MLNNPPKSNNLARVHIWVVGHVQGVGFRAFVEYSAQSIGVTGWVGNVGYETVEALAEGTQAQIDQFVEMMKTGPRGAQINESRVEEETHTGEFTGFEIRASR